MLLSGPDAASHCFQVRRNLLLPCFDVVFQLQTAGSDPRSSATFRECLLFQIETLVLICVLLFELWPSLFRNFAVSLLQLVACDAFLQCGDRGFTESAAVPPGTDLVAIAASTESPERKSCSKSGEIFARLRAKAASMVYSGVRLRAALCRSCRAPGGRACRGAPGSRRLRWQTVQDSEAAARKRSALNFVVATAPVAMASMPQFDRARRRAASLSSCKSR